MKRQRPKRKKPALGSRQWLGTMARSAVLAALALAIFSMVASQFFPDLTFLEAPRRFVARVITPIQRTFATATDGIVGYLRKLKLRSNLEYEYEQLLIKYNEKVDESMLLEEYRARLQSYADLEDERSRNLNLDGIKANVIGWDTSNYTYTLTLDVGTNHGVQDNMAVAVPGALIGLTYNTTASTCNVIGIVDANCNVSALIESSRDQGTLSGTLSIDGAYACRMYYLTYTTLPRPGDRVVTSGISMAIPKGIPIGYVRESTRGLESNKQYIVVEPIADFEHIEYVLVYRYRPTPAEVTDTRPGDMQATFVPLPSAQPVPTLLGQPEPESTGMPSELTTGETPAPSTTPAPSPEDAADTPTPTEEGYVYVDAAPVDNA
ncbi:MAG: hypothetical protein GX810_08090, partial [Clostridiales bacterium]|nr:hypothetical protein [Clostridiales bacterium]